jgi:copper(I)-binding protein
MNKFLLSIRILTFAGLLLWVAGLPAGEAGLAFDGGWIRPLPPGMKMTAAFGLLRNAGTEAIEVTSFASPQFADVSLHRTQLVDGVSRMREVPVLELAAGETLALEPGGYHLMLMMPVGPLSTGQTVTVEMTASDGRSFAFDVTVERR